MPVLAHYCFWLANEANIIKYYDCVAQDDNFLESRILSVIVCMQFLYSYGILHGFETLGYYST